MPIFQHLSPFCWYNKNVHWLPPMHKCLWFLGVIAMKVYSYALGWWCIAVHQNKSANAKLSA